MSFMALYIVADFHPAEQNVNMNSNWLTQPQHTPTMLKVECHTKALLDKTTIFKGPVKLMQRVKIARSFLTGEV